MTATGTDTADLWWPVLNSPGGPAVLCVGHAGAWPGTFRPLARYLDGTATVRALRLPGRDRRLAEPLRTDAGATVAAAAGALPLPADDPVLVVGVCTGAYLAWQLALHWERTGPVGPAALVAVGAAGPDRMDRLHALAAIDGDAIGRRLAGSGATAPELLADDEFRAAIVETYRADLLLAAAPLPAARLRHPILVVSGADDDLTDEEVARWQRFTTAMSRWRRVPDAGHWVMSQRPDRLADCLRDCLAAV